MKINQERLAEMERTTPDTAAVQERVRGYMPLAGLTIKEFAFRVGYGANSLTWFMTGKYHTTGGTISDVRIRRALTDFMDANPVEITTQAGGGNLYETSNVSVMRHWFEYCLATREMAFVYGPPGAQKTFVLRHLEAEHNRRELPKNGHGTRAHYVYCSEQITPRELLKKMARAAAIESRQTILGLIDNMAHHLGKRRTLFVLDEAQHLSIPCLEIVRELNDCEPHCGVLLSGSHKLQQLFQQRAAELEQWNSRIANGVSLPGISTPEAVTIVEAELGILKPEKLKQLLDDSYAVDGYSKNKKYISARRLFRQVARIKADPRFVQSANQMQGAA